MWDLAGHHLDRLEPPYEDIADGLIAGEIVPFFGAAASAIYRPDGENWEPGKPFMPFGGELASIFARASNYRPHETAYETALADLADVVLTLSPTHSRDEIKEALQPVLRRHVGGPPGLALIASWFEHVQSNRRGINRKLRQSSRRSHG